MPYVTLFALNPNLSTFNSTWLCGMFPWIVEETTVGWERCSDDPLVPECAELGVIEETNLDLLGTQSVRFWYEVIAFDILW